MRGVDLAIYADALAGEAASLAARAERARSRLRQAAIEKRARTELPCACRQQIKRRKAPAHEQREHIGTE